MKKPFLKLPVKNDFVEPLKTTLESEDWKEELTPVSGYEGSGQSLGRDSRIGQRGCFPEATVSTARSTAARPGSAALAFCR